MEHRLLLAYRIELDLIFPLYPEIEIDKLNH